MTTAPSFHHRLAIAGALLATFGTALYCALAIPAGDPTAPFFVPAALALIGLTVLMRRYRRALWFAVVGGPITMAVFAIDSFRLRHPDSFIDFVPTVLVVGGAALALAASIVALVRYRHGPNGSVSSIERVGIALFGVALAVLCVYSLALTLSRPSSVSLPGGREALVLDADEDRWIPRTFTVRAGTETLVLVRNPDWIAHTFAVPALDIDLYVAPRGERIVELAAAEPGTYPFECNVTGHERMNGSFVVQ